MLSNQTIERIEQDAKEYSGLFFRNGYFVGATAEATRHEQERKELVEALEEIKTISANASWVETLDGLDLVMGTIHDKAKATLLKYKTQ